MRLAFGAMNRPEGKRMHLPHESSPEHSYADSFHGARPPFLGTALTSQLQSAVDPGAACSVRFDCRFDEFDAAGSVKNGGVRKKIGRKLCPRAASLDGNRELGVEARPSIDEGLRAAAR